jgi:hypothetical protein
VGGRSGGDADRDTWDPETQERRPERESQGRGKSETGMETEWETGAPSPTRAREPGLQGRAPQLVSD